MNDERARAGVTAEQVADVSVASEASPSPTRRDPQPWLLGLVLGGVVVGVIALVDAVGPMRQLDVTSPPIVLRDVVLSTLRGIAQGAVLGGVYGLILGRGPNGRLSLHLRAGVFAVLAWALLSSFLHLRAPTLLTLGIAAAWAAIGGPLLGLLIWLERSRRTRHL
jgi:hypothetical protein